MAKPFILSEEQWAYLKAHRYSMTLKDIAAHLGCSTETVRRRLDALDTQFKPPEEMVWTRPCMSCGDDRERPKGHYFCDRCRSRIDDNPLEPTY